MQDGYFPSELKTGRISPIYKKEDEQLLENYRPVSTLPVFGKIFEKVIYNRLYSFLISKGIINENQFGFRKGHSTSNALNYSVEYIESLLAQRQHVLGIFIDLSKAFDTIDHNKLVTKLERYGIRGNALQLISSYLSNRKQYVNVLDAKSDELPVEFGVPQGSVLGPLLFILYINDICNISSDGKLVLFADDTNIFVAANSISKVYEIANRVLKAIYAISVWGGISSNQLKPLFVTQKKCVRILFGDFEKYVDKFKTCARTRPINKQNLGSKFYEKESTKPLFTKHELLAVENLYRSRCIVEMFKTLKSHVPISLFCLFNPSTRKDNLLITPNPTHQFIYKSAWLWNQFRNTTSLTFSSKFSAVKNSLTQSLLEAQCRYGTEWNNLNFTEF